MAASTTATTSPPKSPSIHVREPSTTKASIQPTSMHALSPVNFTTPSGARSPSASGSMPSSPTSIHSSSSAIFERDIEQPLTATTSSLLTLHKDPHHTARAAAHEPLESAVPSVLSAAVTALGEVDSASLSAPHSGGGGSTTSGGKEIRKGMSMDDISVIAPSPLSPQNWTASTAGSIRLSASRSPSPHLLPLPGLASLGQQQQQQPTTSSPSPSASNKVARSAVPNRINTGGSADGDNGLATATATGAAASPSVIGVVVPPTPNANTFGFASPAGIRPSNSGSTSPQSATASPLIVTPPLPVATAGIPIARSGGASRSTSRPTSIAMSLEELSLAPLVATTADSPVPVPPDVEPIAFSGSAHPRPPSPNALNANNTASKRLSFISYNDLLNSTPMSSFPLSSVTSGAAEPPHQVDVTVRSPRRTRTNSRQSTLNRSPVSDVFGTRTSVFEDENLGGVLLSAAAAAASASASPNAQQPTLQHTHDVGPKGGGEWEREGMGSGLEERLESTFKEEQGKDVAPSNSSAVGA
ncbi:hypothetical protein M407DRAFT_108877 [Tulasnella calospora MUT 4182]|uniref:Uncharacterized protein n=1 Tax=Tulasnella calospora MUT 4182 TaxID=1051891 RepID=A0A0C3QDB0_9AGAM|nr:hypothetical protein M407DRAFT_108877 [Tulasnella calospora MUT 4182]